MRCLKSMQFLALLLLMLVSSCNRTYYEDDFGYEEESGYEDGYEDTDVLSEDDNTGNGDYIEAYADGFAILTSYKIEGNEISKIKDHVVKNKYLNDQQDYATHLAMWEYYTRLIPIQHRIHITEFLVIHGEGDLGGYVEPIIDGRLDQWRMAISIDLVEDLSNVDLQAEFAYVVIHEFAHVLTLNPSQVQVQDESSCQTFYTGEGCSKRNSYINKLYELAWEDIFEENLDPDDLYDKYPDRFVSDYAATNPGEDIAEVFTTYVIEDDVRNGNKIADQKIQLLDAYEELRELRELIRSVPVVRMINEKHKSKFRKILH